MQVPKKHFPIVGLLGLVVVAAAGGGVYYYQFILSHATVTYAPSHRLVFMTAIVQEQGGFHITNTAFLNQTNLPAFNATAGVGNMTGVKYQKYKGESDNRTIDAHVGDQITFYIFGVNATGPDPNLHLSKGHGFDISGSGSFTVNTSANSPGLLGGTNPSNPPIAFGKWYSVTVTFNSAGSYTYLCSIVCSPLHGNMNGQIIVT